MSRRAMTPSAQRLLTALGMPWVEVDGVLTDDLLGSSPGEVMWNGKTLFVDPGAEEWHVFHEAAHHVVCFQLRAGDLHKKNWGFEEDYGATDFAVDEEAKGCGVHRRHPLEVPQALPVRRLADGPPGEHETASARLLPQRPDPAR